MNRLELYAITVLALIVMATLLAYMHSQYTERAFELLKIVVVAIVSFEGGYYAGSRAMLRMRPLVKPEHITRQYLKRLGFIAIGFGMALLLEHIVVYGRVDWADFTGHEYIGLYMIIAGFIALLVSSKHGTNNTG